MSESRAPCSNPRCLELEKWCNAYLQAMLDGKAVNEREGWGFASERLAELLKPHRAEAAG